MCKAHRSNWQALVPTWFSEVLRDCGFAELPTLAPGWPAPAAGPRFSITKASWKLKSETLDGRGDTRSRIWRCPSCSTSIFLLNHIFFRGGVLQPHSQGWLKCIWFFSVPEQIERRLCLKPSTTLLQQSASIKIGGGRKMAHDYMCICIV